MYLTGSAVKDTNWRMRLLVLVFFGIAASGGVLYWRSQLLLASDYQEMPMHGKQRRGFEKAMQSQNYQLDIEELGPKTN